MNGFISEITVYSDFLSIIGLPDIYSEFDKLLTVNKIRDVALYYDKTFKLGDFYVSPIVFRHGIFNGDPVIPLAFLIHDRKFQKCHETFFRHFILCEKISNLKVNPIPIVCDREIEITNAINNVFPDCQVPHCWNHLKNDFKYWLQKQSASQSDIAIYIHDVK